MAKENLIQLDKKLFYPGQRIIDLGNGQFIPVGIGGNNLPSGGGGGITIEPGVLVTGADGTLQFQPLNFNGTTPSDNGSPVALGELGIYNTGKNEPDFTPAPIPPTPPEPPIYDTKYTVVKAVTDVGTESIQFGEITPASATIDWGDGTVDSNLMHTYSTHGEHIIKVDGATHIKFGTGNVGSDLHLITDAIQCGDAIQDCSKMFYLCFNLTSIHTTFIIPDGVTDCSLMFGECRGLTTIPSTLTIPDGVTDCGGMFSGCRGLTTIPSTLTIPDGVTDCGGMFGGCSGLTTIPSTLTIPDGVTNCNTMFSGCSGLTTIPSTLTIPDGVTDCGGMFYSCRGLTTIPSTLKIPQGVLYFSRMFYQCVALSHDIAKLFNQSQFTKSSVSCGGAFEGCAKLFGFAPANLLWLDETPDKWLNTKACFQGCTGLTNFDQIPADWK